MSIREIDHRTSVKQVNGHLGNVQRRAQGSEATRSPKDFLLTLFTSLDANEVRYCVLHSWEGLPDELSSDLDLAVHCSDVKKLVSVFQLLHTKGYTLAQVINYFVDAYSFRFLWFEGSMINSSAVDVISEHQKGPLITPSVKALVSSRRRHGIFWIPDPECEFTYLLGRKCLRGMAPAKQRRRLKVLVEQLGRPTAETLAGEFFPNALTPHVIEACSSGRLKPLLPQLKRRVWKTSLVRHPLTSLGDLLFDAIRRLRRCMQPTGMFIAVMGPDGAGKSTLIQGLLQAAGAAFGCHRLFHWRPMLFSPRNSRSDTTCPHTRPPHNLWWSVGRLFVHVLDYWLGYWLVIRPFLVRSGLVIFDRYFDDLWIDPKRYRYGGPLWLARILRHLVPDPDLILVLDAPDEVILSRKTEVTVEELRRQRRLYCTYGTQTSNRRIINSTASITQVLAESGRAILEFLARRSRKRYPRFWPSAAFDASGLIRE